MKLIKRYKRLEKTLGYYQELFLKMRNTLEKEHAELIKVIEKNPDALLETDAFLLEAIRGDFFKFEESLYNTASMIYRRMRAIEEHLTEGGTEG